MVGKINSGSQALGCATYCLDHDDAKLLLWDGLDINAKDAEALAACSGQQRKELAQEMALHIDTSFNIQANMNVRVEKPVGHIALSFMKEDAPLLDDKKMADIAVEYLERMGYADTQYMVVRHFKENGNPHMHLFFNLVDNNGRKLNTYKDYKRNAEICKDLTVKYGFHLSEGRSKTNVERLHGAERVRYQISNAIDEVLPKCENWKDLGRELLLRGITMNFVKRNDGTIQGLRFGKRSDETGRILEFRGSKIGKKYSYGNLGKALNPNKSAQELGSKSNAHQESAKHCNSPVTTAIKITALALTEMATSQGGGTPVEHVSFQDLPEEEKELILSQISI